MATGTRMQRQKRNVPNAEMECPRDRPCGGKPSVRRAALPGCICATLATVSGVTVHPLVPHLRNLNPGQSQWGQMSREAFANQIACKTLRHHADRVRLTGDKGTGHEARNTKLYVLRCSRSISTFSSCPCAAWPCWRPSPECAFRAKSRPSRQTVYPRVSFADDADYGSAWFDAAAVALARNAQRRPPRLTSLEETCRDRRARPSGAALTD